MEKSEKELEAILKRTIIEKGVPTQVVIDNVEEFVQTSEGKATETDDTCCVKCSQSQTLKQRLGFENLPNKIQQFALERAVNNGFEIY